MRRKVIPWVRCTPMWGLLWIWLYVRDINHFITSLSQCLQLQDQLNEIYQPALVHSTSAQRDTIGERRSCWALASSSGNRGCLSGAPRPVPGRDAREESRGPGGLLGRSPWCCSRRPRCLLREGRIPFPGSTAGRAANSSLRMQGLHRHKPSSRRPPPSPFSRFDRASGLALPARRRLPTADPVGLGRVL